MRFSFSHVAVVWLGLFQVLLTWCSRVSRYCYHSLSIYHRAIVCEAVTGELVFWSHSTELNWKGVLISTFGCSNRCPFPHFIGLVRQYETSTWSNVIKRQVRPWRIHRQRHGDRWKGYDNKFEIPADTKSTRLEINHIKEPQREKNWKAFGQTKKQTVTDWHGLIQIEKAKKWEGQSDESQNARKQTEKGLVYSQSPSAQADWDGPTVWNRRKLRKTETSLPVAQISSWCVKRPR